MNKRLIFLAISNLFTMCILAVLTPKYSWAFQAITGSTAIGSEIRLNSSQLSLKEILGNRKLALKYITLNGENNSVEVDVPGIKGAMNLADTSGFLQANLKLLKIGIQKTSTGNFLIVSISLKGVTVTAQLKYTPGFGAITTAGVKKNLPSTPYLVTLTNNFNGETITYRGIISGGQFQGSTPANTDLELTQKLVGKWQGTEYSNDWKRWWHGRSIASSLWIFKDNGSGYVHFEGRPYHFSWIIEAGKLALGNIKRGIPRFRGGTLVCENNDTIRIETFNKGWVRFFRRQ